MRHSLPLLILVWASLAVAEDETPASAAASAAVSGTEGTARQQPAMDELVLEHTEVIGNRELPKVLYIVPWEKSDPGALVAKPVNTLIDEVLAPLDREEFIRQVDYYSDLYDDQGISQTTTDSAPVGTDQSKE